MTSKQQEQRVVILATGGTIAGRAQQATDNVGYKAAELGVEQLVAGVPALAQHRIEARQVAQLDSKDMDFATWRVLARTLASELARPEVAGVVITHGTDTLEETAWFLQRLLAPSKPVVITAAMRPATAINADGPQNLLDAVCVASDRYASGVLVAFAGSIYEASQVRKVHSYRVDAFASAEGARLGVVEEGVVRWLLRTSLPAPALGLARIERDPGQWPRVQIVMNHAAADGSVVHALLAHGVDGIVVAGTGNGTVSSAMEAALREAQSRGVRVLRRTRCDAGPVMDQPDMLPSAGALSPVKARIELLLDLLA